MFTIRTIKVFEIKTIKEFVDNFVIRFQVSNVKEDSNLLKPWIE
jgi:hypothetical protein